MLNKPFVRRKIKLLQEDLARLQPLAALSFATLQKNRMSYDAGERILERIVTRALDINRHLIAELALPTQKIRDNYDTFLALADLKIVPQKFAKTIAPSSGLRNVLAHEYDEIDMQLIYDSFGDALKQYARYCVHLIKFIDTK